MRNLTGLGNGYIAPLQIGEVIMPDQNWLQKFRRSRTDNWFGGVCGGLGELTPHPLLDLAGLILPHVFHMWLRTPDLHPSMDIRANG